MRKHWYMKYINICPVCGEEEIYKVRMYTNKPTEPEDRVKFEILVHCCCRQS
jgi:hypothetical protein